jgi:hypothetical protein
MTEQIEPSFKKGRGRSKAALALIEAMRKIAEETRPITGRGIGYKLFAAGLIGGMNEMNVVYRALKIAREEGTIPWEWVIDETRELELISTWQNPSRCADGFFYRRDLWQTQPHTVEVVEKGHCPWRAVAGPEPARCRLSRHARLFERHQRIEPGHRRSSAGRPLYR